MDGDEPNQPGWYPAGDSELQRFYAGRGYGWTDNYQPEIWARDPYRPWPPRPRAEELVVFVALALLFAVIAIVWVNVLL